MSSCTGVIDCPVEEGRNALSRPSNVFTRNPSHEEEDIKAIHSSLASKKTSRLAPPCRTFWLKIHEARARPLAVSALGATKQRP